MSDYTITVSFDDSVFGVRSPSWLTDPVKADRFRGELARHTAAMMQSAFPSASVELHEVEA